MSLSDAAKWALTVAVVVSVFMAIQVWGPDGGYKGEGMGDTYQERPYEPGPPVCGTDWRC